MDRPTSSGSFMKDRSAAVRQTSIAVKHRWQNQSTWEILERAPCMAGASFVSILTGGQLVPQALCLHHQLQRVASACPVYLVYDDVPKAALRRLSHAMGKERLLPARWLFEQASNLSLPIRRRDPNGRRLFENAARFFSQNLMIKLFLFALPSAQFSRVMYLDLDLLIRYCLPSTLVSASSLQVEPRAPSLDWKRLFAKLELRCRRNIDAVVSLPFWEPVAAVHAIACGGYRWDPFNSGVLVIKPSLPSLKGLLLRTCFYVAEPNHYMLQVRRVWYAESRWGGCGIQCAGEAGVVYSVQVRRVWIAECNSRS